MNAKLTRRLLAIVLTVAMVLSIMPFSAFAASTKNGFVDTLTVGDKIVIVNTANNVALSSEYSGFYNKATPVTVANDSVTGYTDADVWTVGEGANGAITLSTAAGKKLSMGSGYTSMPLDDVNTDWTVEAAKTAGHFYLKNVARGNRVEYQTKYNTWSCYDGYQEADEALYALKFFKVDGGSVGPIDPPTPPVDPDAPLTDGQKVVIYNPGSGNAMSTKDVAGSAFYRDFAPVTPKADGTVEVASDLIWTVGANEDGTFTFSDENGRKLSMNANNSSLPMDEVNPNWKVEKAATADCYYIINAARTDRYVEWYGSKNEFSAYTYSAANESIYALQFLTPVEKQAAGPIEVGSQVMLMNVNGVALANQDANASPNIEATPAEEVDGKIKAGNHARLFTVEQNGEYLRFYNETDGYLCSNGTGNNAFYSKEASDDADWTVTNLEDGFKLESRTAKFNGKYSQFLEYFGGSFKTYSMNNPTDISIYVFKALPTANTNLIGGIVNDPTVVLNEEELLNAYVGQDYSFQFTLDAEFGVKSVDVAVNGQKLVPTVENGIYTVVVPTDKVTGTELKIVVTAVDNKDVAFKGEATVAVKDEPAIVTVTPAQNAQTLENKKPVISATISNCGTNPTVEMKVNGEVVKATLKDGVVSYTPATDMADGTVTVTVTVTRQDGKVATRTWKFTVGEANEQLYFGQLHSHTAYSDGAGSIDNALNYLENMPEESNVQFVAFTDHSNYFDSTSNANPEGALYDMSLATADSVAMWNEFNSKVNAHNEKATGVVALPGFEMTWSGGPGHINTWNTPGIVSRNNKTLNNKTDDAGMKAYYALLSQPEGVDTISQFNHPGSTFGTFKDFDYWDAVIDTRMYLVEVGNGEGQIGAGGYYPSYEYYTMALDKGWHLAPTNNQDNHKGKWGNANDARDVILTEDLSPEGLYAAIRQYKVYATEDKNLEIRYTVNGLPLGSIISEVPESLNLNVSVYDPDKSDSISKVEVIVNSGKVAYTWDDPAALKAGDLSCTLAPDYTYYYIRVTEGDGDLAVTAPVWVGETLKLGISALECGTATPVTDEELTLTTTIFNSEATAGTVKSIVYTTNGSEVLGTDTTGYEVPASGKLSVDFKYTPTVAKVMTVTAKVTVELDGKEYEFTKDITLDVLDADQLLYIGIDASHYNEYVAGNYKDSMGNFANLAAGYSLRAVYLKTSEELIEAAQNKDGKYKMIILTAPSRRLMDARNDPRTYSDAEKAALAAFNAAGGTVVLAGWSDNYENYDEIKNNPDCKHMAATQNELLEALGSSLRIADDATHDDSLNGGQTQRLYFSSYDFDSFLLDRVELDEEHPNDVMYTERYSQYGGASIYAVDAEGKTVNTLPSNVQPIVYGHASTYSKDTDGDGLGGDNVPKYQFAEGDNRLLVLASEEIEGKGLIIVSGAAFMSNFEVQYQAGDSGAEKNYSNFKICENLCAYLNPVKITPIAEIQAQKEEGFKYTLEGVVTSNASGYDKSTAFFDCIYVQDETAGICCFPVAGNYKIGDVVRITGTTDWYQGEAELQVSSIEVIGTADPVKPTPATAKDLKDNKLLGSLVKVEGTVESFIKEEGLIQTIYVKDANGELVRIFIDGYICSDKDIENCSVGAHITAIGLASYDDTFADPTHEGKLDLGPRIRINDRKNVVCTGGHNCAIAGFTDVPDAWYHEAADWAVGNGYIKGMTETTFAPKVKADRAMLVTILYRMAGEPEVTAKNPFTDVKEGTYYYNAVLWAASKGIVLGKTTTTFAPKDALTREQAAAILYRYAKMLGKDVTATADLGKLFPDGANVSKYAVDPMKWAVANHIINGNKIDGVVKLDAYGNANRGQLAIILMRFDTLING